MSTNEPEDSGEDHAFSDEPEADWDEDAEYVEPQEGQDSEPTGRPETDKHPG